MLRLIPQSEASGRLDSSSASEKDVSGNPASDDVKVVFSGELEHLIQGLMDFRNRAPEIVEGRDGPLVISDKENRRSPNLLKEVLGCGLDRGRISAHLPGGIRLSRLLAQKRPHEGGFVYPFRG
jgi:hypothetical protein